jgi:predicted nucleic acid-binding protein
MTSYPPEEEFDYSLPFEVDIGRAAVIAEGLRESGYPRCTADIVIAELAKPERERSIIGRFAADQLEKAGWRP